MRRCTPALLALLLGSLMALPASAQWKWRDNAGRIQYSDLPPPSGVADKDILQRPAGVVARQAPAFAAPAASAASGAVPPAPSGKEPELEAKRKAAEKEQADKAKAEEQKLAAAKAENCQRAKAQVRALESGQRMARINEKGEREIMDDQTRAAEARRAQDAIASDCKP